MVCDRVLDGLEVQALAAKPRSFGRELEAVDWVCRVEMWYMEGDEGMDFTEFRVFDGGHGRKTIRVAGY